MSKKAKLELIIKILLILVFVPVGVVSLGAQITGTGAWSESRAITTWFSEYGFGYKTYFDNFANDWHVVYPGAGDNIHGPWNFTINTLKNKQIRNAVQYLARVFSRAQGNYLVHSIPTDYPTDLSNAKANEIGNSMDPQWISQSGVLYPKYYESGATLKTWTKTEINNINDSSFTNVNITGTSDAWYNNPYAISFFNVIYATDGLDGTLSIDRKVTNSNLYTNNQISISTEANIASKTLEGRSYLPENDNEEAQQVLWNGNFKARAVRNTGNIRQNKYAWNSSETRLYQANKAYNDSLKVKNNANTGNIEDINVSAEEDILETRTLKEDNKNYIVVGPFKMSNHPYAEDKSGMVAEYSGRNVELYKNTLVGLIDCEITIQDKNKANRSYKSSDAGFTICYGTNGKKDAPNGQGYPSSYYSSTLIDPQQYRENRVPYPNNDFYIKIEADKINDGDYMTNLKLTARDTVASGDGATIQQKGVTTTLNLIKNPNKFKYKCSVCGEYESNGEEYSSSQSNLKDKTSHDHTYKCNEEEGSHSVHEPSCFEWKTGLKYKGGNVANGTDVWCNTANTDGDINNYEYYICLRRVCPLSKWFIDKYGGEESLKKEIKNSSNNYIEKSLEVTAGGEKEVYLFVGQKEGGDFSSQEDGRHVWKGENAQIFVGVKVDVHTGTTCTNNDGFIHIKNSAETQYRKDNEGKSPDEIGDLKNYAELWDTYNFTDEDYVAEFGHIHRWSCYNDDLPTKKSEFKCAEYFNPAMAHFTFGNKTNMWVNCHSSDSGYNGCPKCDKNTDGTWNCSHHIHTNECLKKINGTWEEEIIRSYKFQANSIETSGTDLLVVKNCAAMVRKKELSLDLNIQLKTDVSVKKWIHEVQNGNTTYTKDIQNASGAGTSGSGNRGTGYAYYSEDYRKQYPATIEAGDTVRYIIEVSNKSSIPVNATLKDVLPDKITKNSSNQYELEISRVSKQSDDTFREDSYYSQANPNPSIVKNGAKTSATKEIDTSYFPGAKQLTKGTMRGYYLTLGGNTTVYYAVTVKIDTAEGSYDKQNPIENKVTIDTWRADVSQDNPYFLNHVANEEEFSQNHTSSDWYICKKYNETVDKYITAVNRADGTTGTVNGEYLVDENSYRLGGARAGKTNANKEQRPIYIENGDVVTYTIAVNNGANQNEPYYTPNKTTVYLEDTLPLGAESTVQSVTINTGTELHWKQNGAKLNIDFKNTCGQTTYLTCKVKINKNSANAYNYDLRTNTVNITKLENVNGKSTTAENGLAYCKYNGAESNANIVNGGKILNNIRESQATSSDYLRIKEYNVVIDKYIADVSHVETRGGTQITYNSLARKSNITVSNGAGTQDNTKNNNPVSAEFGDRITYQIRIYNTTNQTEYNVGRENQPYKQPQFVYVDLEDTLPNKYSELTVSGAGVNYTLSNNNQTIRLNNVQVPANGVTTITVSLVVEEVAKDTVETNEVKIYNPVRNINSYNIINNGKRLNALDKYKINDYAVTLDEYISSYDHQMMDYNNNNGFTTGEQSTLDNRLVKSKADKEKNPLDVEKYETLTFTTKITNTINTTSGREAESNAGSYGKYYTRVRPTEVTQTLDYGLDWTGFKATWYNANGTVKRDITSAIGYPLLDDTTNKRKIYKYTINDEEIILSPGEYIIYETKVTVSESNLYLGKLKSYAELTTLTNVNRNDRAVGSPKRNAATNHQRIVAQDNDIDKEVATPNNIVDATRKNDNDFVRLKDLVVAGTVWVDNDRNGYKNNEAGKQEVVVKLYRTDQKDPVKTLKTNANGFYSFGRQWKSFNKDGNGNYTSTGYIQYYVEFEYDGATYKATEIYGGDSDGVTNGKYNLNNGNENNDENGKTWRQGYSNLPGAKSGKTEYMTDSNAYEFDNVRNGFDSYYQTIGFNKSYNGTTPQKDLKYTKNGHTSTLDEDSSRAMRARSFIKQDYTTTVNENLENTNTLFLQKYNGHYNQYPETEYLKFINLGLVKREQVDISIEADVYSVKNTINGEEMTYDYGANDADSTKNNYSAQLNSYRLNKAYNLNLYQADYNYRYDEYYNEKNVLKDYKQENSEMNVEVTYRVRITNNGITNDETKLSEDKHDIPIETAINELAIYYDKNFIKDENQNIVLREKDDATGLLKDKEGFPSIRVNYGTKEELDTLNQLNDLKTLTAEQQTQKTNLSEKTDIRSQISRTSRYGNNASNDTNSKDYNVLYLTGDKMDQYYLKEDTNQDGSESRYIQLTFIVDKEKIGDLDRALKITNDEDMGFEMISEISAYTTKYSENYYHKGLAGQFAGLIDRDSNPGKLSKDGINTNSDKNRNKPYLTDLENYDNYEDDTYKVGIKMQLFEGTREGDPENTQGMRSIRGIVWDDARSEITGTEDTGIQYLGNGEYNLSDSNNENASKNPNVEHSNDKPVSGVKVSLIEVIQTDEVDGNGNAKYYEYPAKDSQGNLIYAITNENGEYTLNDYIPGYYKVRFDYGYDKDREDNILYNGQDYKSTTYFNEKDGDKVYYAKDYGTDNIGGSGNFTYFDNVKDALKEVNKSDAQDDEIRRLNVNTYSETMTTTQAQVFSETTVTKAKDLEKLVSEEEKEAALEVLKSHNETLIKNTKMYAESAIFYVKPENVNSADIHVQADVSNIKGENYTPKDEHDVYVTSAKFDETRLWRIDNLDFGLEYRPESSIVLDKNIETLELVTSDNKTLVKLCFKDDEEGNRVIDEKKSKGSENVQFLANAGKEQQGFVYINMDTDILEGCTVKVDYQMDVENQSEVDRVGKNLDAIKFESGANAYGSAFKVYTTHQLEEDDKEYTYSANATAAQLLAYQYLDEDGYNAYTSDSTKDDKYNYLKKLKKPYVSEGETTVNGVILKGQEYYGMYLGETYYTAKVGDNDKVAELKVDHILDYIDNDFTFRLDENNAKDRLWQTTTSEELWRRKLLDFGKVNKEGTYNLIDQYGIRYDTESRSNLALSVDDNKLGKYWSQDNEGSDIYTDRNRGNVSLSRFLKTKNAVADKDPYKDDVNAKKGAQQYTGRINVVAEKVLSADDIVKATGLSYTNIAEAVQYTSLTGRRTKLPDDNRNGGVIGNANVLENWTGYDDSEDDTDATEVITISPPTGLTK